VSRGRIRAVGFVLGLIGLVVAVISTADDVDSRIRPTGTALAVAAAFALVSLAAAGRSWATLLAAHGQRRQEVVGALYLSQLSKYLPAGGLLQAAGQVTMSTGAAVPVARAAVAFPVAALEIVVTGALLAVGLALRSEVPTWVRGLAAAAPLGMLALHPRLLRGILGFASRLSSRVPDPTNVPDVDTIARSTAWAAVNMASTSVAFAALLGSVAPDTSAVVAFSAFAAAWVIGFVVVPIPSGLGIREGVLVLAIPGLLPGEILAASIAHRAVTLLAEVVLTTANGLGRRRTSHWSA
jgi:hypothetical protein